MAANKQTVKVVVDKAGKVEILGPSTQQELKKVAQRLGVKEGESLVRAEPIPPEQLDHVIGRAGFHI